MAVGACPRGNGAGLLGECSPVRAIALLHHWAAVHRGGALCCALRIRAGRPAPRSVSHRRAGALMSCPVCRDSLGQVPEESIALSERHAKNGKSRDFQFSQAEERTKCSSQSQGRPDF